VPIEKMAKSIPWLALDPNAVPAVNYYGFNTTKPPFNNPLVRQAFAAATDRKVFTSIATSWGTKNVRPATSFTPRETLGRDLYGQVGWVYDPAKARDMLTKAGYPDGQGMPPVRIAVSMGTRSQAADLLLNMWRENLKVNAEWETLGSNFAEYVALVEAGNADIYWIGWTADVNDPDNFLKGVFYSSGEHNYPRFSNATFDRLVDQAANSQDPATRQSLYIQAERILCEEQAVIVPLYHFSYSQ
jgi:oligopeptide transport system substrate-binding protein